MKVDLQITDKIAWLLSKPKRIKIAVGGRGSAKSIGICDCFLMFMDNGERVCFTREFQNTIDDSVHSTLKDEIDRLELKGFSVTDNRIRSSCGGEGFYRGLARNITGLKSLAGVSRLMIEEGESVSEESLKVLTPSIRSTAADNAEDSDPPEIWIAMNRGSREGAIAKKYLARADEALEREGYYEDDLMMAVEVNWRDNPWFPPELEQERLDDYEHLSREEYDHVWEGKYYDSVENALIKLEWFDACIDAHKDLGFEAVGAKIAAHDPSDGGADSKGYAMRHGSVLVDVQEKLSGDVNEGGHWATGIANQQLADQFLWDVGGMGTGLKEQVAKAFRGTRCGVEMFNGAESPDNPTAIYDPCEVTPIRNQQTNKDTFRNKRAQYYFMLRDRIYRTYRAVVHDEYQDPDKLLSFDSSIELLPKLRSELCRLPIKPNANGQLELYTKEAMKSKFNLDSPNLGDSVMMTMRTMQPRINNVRMPKPIRPMGMR